MVPLSAQQAYTPGALGTYLLTDQDYWRRVTGDLDVALDLPLPYGGGSDIEGRVTHIMKYLHSFPSLRCQMTSSSEWFGGGTLELTDQWVRDGVDAVQEGRMIEYWLQELRAIIKECTPVLLPSDIKKPASVLPPYYWNKG